MPKSNNYRTLFKDIALSKGYKIMPPKPRDRNNSVDIRLEGQINGNPIAFSVDIKKKNNKNANSWVYIEYKNAKGYKGWVYGSSSFIAFETNTSFILVPRKNLLNWLDSSGLVRWDLPYVDQSWNSKYRLFRRAGTLETISQIRVDDLLEIESSQCWKKV